MEKLCIDDLFKCICGYMVDDPYETECCGMLYCQACQIEYNFLTCSNCSKTIKFRKNIFARNLLQKIELNCINECGEKFTYENMKIHLLRCEMKKFKCTIENCLYSGFREDLLVHISKTHPIYLLVLLEHFQEFDDPLDKIMKIPLNSRKAEKNTLETTLSYNALLRNFNIENNNFLSLANRNQINDIQDNVSVNRDYEDDNYNYDLDNIYNFRFNNHLRINSYRNDMGEDVYDSVNEENEEI